MRKVMVTGGAGFIGSWLVRHFLDAGDTLVLNVDKLTYAADQDGLRDATRRGNHQFERADVCNEPRMDALIERFQPDAIIHLAAESHSDRSIDSAGSFI